MIPRGGKVSSGGMKPNQYIYGVVGEFSRPATPLLLIAGDPLFGSAIGRSFDPGQVPGLEAPFRAAPFFSDLLSLLHRA